LMKLVQERIGQQVKMPKCRDWLTEEGAEAEMMRLPVIRAAVTAVGAFVFLITTVADLASGPERVLDNLRRKLSQN
jgi:hypothetical protein